MQLKQLFVLPIIASLALLQGCGDSTPERPAMTPPPDAGKPYKVPTTKAEKIAAINASAADPLTKKAAIEKVNSGPGP